MMETMMNWAAQPATAWMVLAGAALVIAVEAVRASKAALWWEMLEEDE